MPYTTSPIRPPRRYTILRVHSSQHNSLHDENITPSPIPTPTRRVQKPAIKSSVLQQKGNTSNMEKSSLGSIRVHSPAITRSERNAKPVTRPTSTAVSPLGRTRTRYDHSSPLAYGSLPRSERLRVQQIVREATPTPIRVASESKSKSYQKRPLKSKVQSTGAGSQRGSGVTRTPLAELHNFSYPDFRPINPVSVQLESQELDDILPLSYWIEAGTPNHRSNPPAPIKQGNSATSVLAPTEKSVDSLKIKRKRKKPTTIPVPPLRELFDMDPPPPTPEEDRKLQFYGSKYDRWRGMRF